MSLTSTIVLSAFQSYPCNYPCNKGLNLVLDVRLDAPP